MKKAKPDETIVKVKIFTKGKPIILIPGKDRKKTGLSVLVMTADVSKTSATGRTWWAASVEGVGMMIHELIKNNPDLLSEIMKWMVLDISNETKKIKPEVGKKK